MEQVTALNLGTVSNITLNVILPNATSFNSCRRAANEWEAGEGFYSSTRTVGKVISEIFYYCRLDGSG